MPQFVYHWLRSKAFVMLELTWSFFHTISWISNKTKTKKLKQIAVNQVKFSGRWVNWKGKLSFGCFGIFVEMPEQKKQTNSEKRQLWDHQKIMIKVLYRKFKAFSCCASYISTFAEGTTKNWCFFTWGCMCLFESVFARWGPVKKILRQT